MTGVVSKIGQKETLNSGTVAAKASEVLTVNFLNGWIFRIAYFQVRGTGLSTCVLDAYCPKGRGMNLDKVTPFG